MPLICAALQRNLSFLDGFFLNTQISNLMKIRPIGAQSFYARRDGRTDRLHKLRFPAHKTVEAYEITTTYRSVLITAASRSGGLVF